MVEKFNVEALRLSKQFLAQRTLKEEPTKLKDIFPSSNYCNDEITKKDNFISPYIGKIYKNATEILSMGLEQIFEPVYFYKTETEKARITDDNEYLNFILGMIAMV